MHVMAGVVLLIMSMLSLAFSPSVGGVGHTLTGIGIVLLIARFV
jgi:hypothetical protein